MPKLRVYVDTSVFGGVFDKGFDVASKEFFAEVTAGRFVVLLSGLTYEELDDA